MRGKATHSKVGSKITEKQTRRAYCIRPFLRSVFLPYSTTNQTIFVLKDIFPKYFAASTPSELSAKDIDESIPYDVYSFNFNKSSLNFKKIFLQHTLTQNELPNCQRIAILQGLQIFPQASKARLKIYHD